LRAIPTSYPASGLTIFETYERISFFLLFGFIVCRGIRRRTLPLVKEVVYITP